MNLLTSQDVFAGPYLDDPVEREKFGRAFLDMTNGFLAFPICLPGTTVWRGRQGRLYVISVLKKAAARSKANMKVTHAWQGGSQSTCLSSHSAPACVEVCHARTKAWDTFVIVGQHKTWLWDSRLLCTCLGARLP